MFICDAFVGILQCGCTLTTLLVVLLFFKIVEAKQGRSKNKNRKRGTKVRTKDAMNENIKQKYSPPVSKLANNLRPHSNAPSFFSVQLV